jgi:beta-phosphoglucomutase-like phosphatase (HAD superfamily)
MIKAVILDLDDTVCLTEEACWNLENETLAAIGRAPIPRELHKATWGKKMFEEAISLPLRGAL